ncbi:MAG: restriction endonuclease subunit S [Nitrosospira sp.]
MELRPGYKQTEVGLIPEEWGVDAIGDTFDIGGGISASRTQLGSNGYCYLHYGDIHKSTQSFINVRLEYLDIPKLNVSLSQVPFKSLLADGDVVFVDASEDDEGTSKHLVVVNPEAIPYISGLHTIVAKSKTRSFDNAYKQYCFQTRNLRQQFYYYAVGTKVSGISKTNIKKIFIPRPPVPEQRAIAAALSDMDALIGALDRLIAKKRDLKQAAMQQLLTGQTRLPGFSETWETKRLGEIFTFSGGFTASRDQFTENGYCYLHYGDIHKSNKTFIDLDAEFLDIPKLNVQLSDINSSALLSDGDMVFVDASEDSEGTSKHVVVVNPRGRTYISGLHTITAKDKFQHLDNGFKRYCFQMPRVREQFRFYAAGTKVSGISKTNIAKIMLEFPSLPEQTAIAAILSDMDAEITALEARRDKTRALKQGMMQELLTGRIRLT